MKGANMNKEYYEQGECPVCKSQNITYDGSEIDGQYMYYKNKQ